MAAVSLFTRSSLLKLFKFYKSFGRIGDIEGLFTATDEDIEYLKGKALDFGEALGKHSEIYFPFEMDQIEVVSDDQDFIKKFNEILPDGVGSNPFDVVGDE